MDPISLILLGVAGYSLHEEEKKKRREAIYHLLYGLEEAVPPHRKACTREAITAMLEQGELPIGEYIAYAPQWKKSRSPRWWDSDADPSADILRRQQKSLVKAVKRIESDARAGVFEWLAALATYDGVITGGVLEYVVGMGQMLGMGFDQAIVTVCNSLFEYADTAVAYLAVRGMVATGGMTEEGMSMLHDFLDAVNRLSQSDQKAMVRCFSTIEGREAQAVWAIRDRVADEVDEDFASTLAFWTIAPVICNDVTGRGERWLHQNVIALATGDWKKALLGELAELEQPCVGEEDDTSAGIDQPDTNSETIFAAFRTLGLSPNATLDEVRQAYRQLCLEFHPDAVSGKDLNPAFLEFAAQKFREINDAYSLLRYAFAEDAS